MSSFPAYDATTADGARRYWEERARSFARSGRGLRAVCSYGMPWFYNRSIHLMQYLALSPHLRFAPGETLLDLGCGVGRWSVLAAQRGARVTGVDLSPKMIEEAQKRLVENDSRFVVGDISTININEYFDRVLAVTVLQHILDDLRWQQALDNIARHLAPGGRAVVLETAPSRPSARCDTPVFRARTAAEYGAAFAKAGLRIDAITGVDPTPLKTMLLPHYRKLPAGVRDGALLAVTAASLPVDAMLGRRLTKSSWHKVFVLVHA